MSIRYVNGLRIVQYTPEEILARKVRAIMANGIAPNGMRLVVRGR